MGALGCSSQQETLWVPLRVVSIQAQVLDLLQELKTQLNTAIILVTHDLGVIANFADRVQVMYAGQVVERGTTKEIFNEANVHMVHGFEGPLAVHLEIFAQVFCFH